MMKIGPAVAAAAVFAIASPVCAQDAVQWRVEDGGNGHWYELRVKVGNWFACRTAAIASGGDLACPTTAEENAFVEPMIPPAVGNRVFIGGRQLVLGPANEGWSWVDGSTWSFTDWFFNQPNGGEGFLVMMNDNPGITWGDYVSDSTDIGYFLIEWSADCNADGIVDYGQIRDGTFPDVNANGVPDCCEPGESCFPCPGDVTNGGTVDAADLSILLAAWGTNGQGEFDTDLDGNGLVDGGDLALVLGGWGACP
jgi:hypothetical protein